MSSILVLLNPHAGGGRALRFEPEIRTRIRTDHPGVRFVVTESIQAAHALIGDTAPDTRIVLVGGDGTVNRMLPALLGSERELAIVPLGSGNDIARALGLCKLTWQQALARRYLRGARSLVCSHTWASRDSKFWRWWRVKARRGR